MDNFANVASIVAGHVVLQSSETGILNAENSWRNTKSTSEPDRTYP